MKIEDFIKQWFGTLEHCQIAIKKSHSLLAEGAWTNEGLYWISPKGKVILVNTIDNQSSMGHEEYANTKLHCSLEDALRKGYVRIQAVSPQYLFIDHAQESVRGGQVPALTGFFFDQHMVKIPYGQMAIDRAGDMKSFKTGQNNVALQFAINGEVVQDDTEEVPVMPGATNVRKRMDIDDMQPIYKRPGVNPFGDATDYSFGKWIAERKKM